MCSDSKEKKRKIKDERLFENILFEADGTVLAFFY
jgi:hypothetical protein